MARKARVDAELVRRGLARSRDHAADLVHTGRVLVHGSAVTKPATQIAPGDPLRVVDVPDEVDWASRGAHKLLGALEAFRPLGLEVSGRRCLDAGASTGGFTDVLLHHGAAEVVAADVGYGQLVWRLRSDSRVHVLDRTNVRSVDAASIGGAVDLVVSDLSFISLRLVLPALRSCCRPGADLMLMVKPQFEVGKERVGAGGVVRSPALRAEAVGAVAHAARALGFVVRAAAASPLPGPSGNVEYFLLLRAPGDAPDAPAPAPTPTDEELTAMIACAVAEGPA